MATQPANLGSQFYPKLVQMTSELGMKPEDLLAVMVSESGINPAAHNAHGGASGLIQFMPNTLDRVGFEGGGSQFAALTGEEQLPYIQRLIEGNMRYNGGPFTSAAQYYVANFWPVALRLPGVKNNDPSTVIVEDNPPTVVDPHTGKTVSRKYYQIGVDISPQQESAAYRANPLFHGSTPGAITYGDMMSQVEKNKQTPMYQQALLAMQQSTGYQAPAQEELAQNTPSSTITSTTTPILNDVDQTLERYLEMVSARSTPTMLIKIATSDYTDAVEFARILCSALDTELHLTAYAHSNSHQVEVECELSASAQRLHQLAVAQLADAIADTFPYATRKFGSIRVALSYSLNKRSSYQPISLKTAETQFRKFQLKTQRKA